MLLLPSAAQAAVELYPVDNLLDRFQGVQDLWASTVAGAAERLFWSLALISLTWTMCMMLFRRADFGELFAELVRFIVMTGIFWWLLNEGGVLIQQILESMRLLGEDGSGGGGQLQPSGLLRSGYRLFFAVAEQSESDEWKEADKIVGLAMAAVIMALIALAAVSMMLITLMTWVLGYAGLFLLGFGGARWTSGVAINYYKHVLAVGMSYFVMLLLAGIGNQFLEDYSTGVAADVTLPNLAIMLVAAIVLLALLVRIPAMVSSMVLGARFGAGSGSSFSGHVMALGGTAIAAGVGHAGSGAQALYSAYNAPSAAPPPAPMISMPTIQVQAPPAAAGGASAPMATPIISVHHLDGMGMNPPPVTLSVHGMYPPPAGAAQGSVFGATPSAHEVARTQQQAGPGNSAAAGGAVASTPAPPAAAMAGALANAAGDGNAATPASLAAAASATPGAAPEKIPALDAQTLQRSHEVEPGVPAAGLAATTTGLPASPVTGLRGRPADAAPAASGPGAMAKKAAGPAAPGFSSFASQPLSGSALPAAGSADGRGKAGAVGRGDTHATAAAPSSSAAAASNGVASNAREGRDGRDLTRSSAAVSTQARVGARSAAPSLPEGAAVAPASAHSPRVAAADGAADATAAIVPPARPAGVLPQPPGRGWFARLLAALRRWRKRDGDGDAG
ncbi:P-type conjugative transfer protein TrbL [Stenotrophomonas rhizophila]|uniref:P-type conjugative transfer protein TrbL n=1 Tax=Stenotrophomonas rhizophila TaxID=216778 RepID=UPI001E34BCC2|nr:P-type conjugative transfer protein TrbL [Stenotrophomonas rhizophila]MCC7634556.1 P-type conjugative transfer protein TrbL [Stenotrophomonas rhizophila]MCC7664175.1 P-type conjugative transfer protein TrbL [Stenotrophomonas rhizophila]